MEKMAALYQKFIKEIRTQEELNQTLAGINLVEKYIYKRGERQLSVALKGMVSEGFRKNIYELEKSKTFPTSESELERLFSSLKQILLTLPVLKLTIAFEPTAEFLDKLAIFIEKKSKRKIILDLIINPQIIAGAIIEYKGAYRDFSTRGNLDQFYLKG